MSKNANFYINYFIVVILVVLNILESRSQTLHPPNFVSLLPQVDDDYFTGNAAEEIPEYARQLQQCKTVNPTIDYNFAFPTFSDIQIAIQDIYPFLSNISALSSNPTQIIEATLSNPTLRSLLYAPIALASVISIALICSVPMFIGRCCCPKICCKPKFKIHRFPKKGACGAISSIATSIALSMLIFVALVIIWSSFQSMFLYTQTLSCNIMESSYDIRDWAFDILSKSTSDAESHLRWASDELNSVNTTIQNLSTQVDAIFDSIDAETEKLQQNITAMEIKFPNITFGDLNQYLNTSLDTFSEDYAEAQTAVMYYLLDAENFIQNISTQINRSSAILRNTGSYYLNMITNPLFAFTTALANNNSGKTKSFFPEIMPIPLILPDGLASGESLNTWASLLFQKSTVIGFILLMPILIPILCILIGTCLLACQYFAVCRREKDNVRDSHQNDFDIHNDSVRKSKRLGQMCCGCCLTRFGCGALYILLPIVCIVTILLILFNSALHYSCGVLTLSPKRLFELADVLDIYQVAGLSKADPQIAPILELAEAALEVNEPDIDKTIGMWKEVLMSISGTNVTTMISDALSEINISAFDISAYVLAIDESKSLLLEAAGNFSNQFRLSNQNSVVRSMACNTCNTSLWSIASDTYTEQGFDIPMNCTIPASMCNSTSPYAAVGLMCKDAFCEAYSFSKDMDNIAVQFNSSMSEVALNIDVIKETLRQAEADFSTFPITLEARANQLMDDTFARLNLSIITLTYSSMANQICYGFSPGYAKVSWGNYVICTIIPVLVVVQALVNIRLGGIGHKQIQKSNKDIERGGQVSRTSSAYRQPQPIDFDYDGQPIEDIYVNPIEVQNPPTPTKEVEAIKDISHIEIEMTTLSKDDDNSLSEAFSSAIDLDLVSSSPIVGKHASTGLS